MKNHFTTAEEVEQAVNAGLTVHWINEGYKVVNGGKAGFLIGWNVGGHDENFVGLLWTYKGAPHYHPSDFFVIE